VFGEVGSRQWNEPERPLPADAVDALARRGFTGGGPEKNYAKDGLPRSASELAILTDALLRAAYSLDDDYAPIVHHINVNDVTLPRAEPFTRDLIETHLREREVQFLRDQDGDFRVDFSCPGSDQPVTMWLVAEGGGDTIFHVWALAPQRPIPATRTEAVERCNEWNAQHRWPTARVLDREDTWQIMVGSQLDLKPGVTKPLFALFTDRVVAGALEFWEWIAAPVGVPSDIEPQGGG